MCTHILHFHDNLGVYVKNYAQINPGGEVEVDYAHSNQGADN